jgi:alpha-tubulin suppressor-like RCC1 family protein
VDVIEFDGLTNATSASKLTAGFGHACAVSGGGDIACWGDPIDGQGAFLDRASTSLASISAGPFHTCIVVVGVVGGFRGTLQCVGQNFDGQLGQGNTVDSPDTLVDVRVRVGNVLAVQTGATRVTSSDSFTRAAIAGGAKCWGANDVGQLGDGKTNSAKALLVKLAAGVRQP